LNGTAMPGRLARAPSPCEQAAMRPEPELIDRLLGVIEQDILPSPVGQAAFRYMHCACPMARVPRTAGEGHWGGGASQKVKKLLEKSRILMFVELLTLIPP